MATLDVLRRGTRTPIVILCAGWLLVFLYAYPGQMTWDSYQYLAVVREGGATNIQPPVASAFWWLLEFVMAGPFVWLAVQVVGFSYGAFVILRRLTSPHVAAYLAVAVLIFPAVLLPLGAIWTYSLMATSLVVGVAGITSDLRGAKITGLVALGLAIGLAPTGGAATLPIVLGLVKWRDWAGGRRYAAALGTWLALAVIALGLNTLLRDRDAHPNATTLAPLDIAGIVSRSGKLSDAELERVFTGSGNLIHADIQASLRKLYGTRDVNKIATSDTGMWNVVITGANTTRESELVAIEQARRELAVAHPGAYVKHRYSMAVLLLGLGKFSPDPTLALLSMNEEISIARGIPTRHSELQEDLVSSYRALGQTPLCSPWIYLLLSLALLYPARRSRVALVLLISGLAAELAAFFVASSVDYRLSHWMIAASLFVAAVIYAERRGQR